MSVTSLAFGVIGVEEEHEALGGGLAGGTARHAPMGPHYVNDGGSGAVVDEPGLVCGAPGGLESLLGL